MNDPNDMSKLQAVLAELRAKLEDFEAKRKANSKGLKHPEWESKPEMKTRLDVAKAELAIVEARLPNLRLEVEAAILNHIADCYREIIRLKKGGPVASGEIDTTRCIEVANHLNEDVEKIAELNNEIKDIQRDLEDDDLWEDN